MKEWRDGGVTRWGLVEVGWFRCFFRMPRGAAHPDDGIDTFYDHTFIPPLLHSWLASTNYLQQFEPFCNRATWRQRGMLIISN